MSIALTSDSLLPVLMIVEAADGTKTTAGVQYLPIDVVLGSASGVTWNSVSAKPDVIAAGANIDGALTELGLSVQELAADSDATIVDDLKTYVNNLVAKLVASGLFTQAGN
jgi:hypothetical protein